MALLGPQSTNLPQRKEYILQPLCWLSWRTTESEAVSSNCLGMKAPNKPMEMQSLLSKAHWLPRKVWPEDNFKCQSGGNHFVHPVHLPSWLVQQAVPSLLPLPVTCSKVARKQHVFQDGRQRAVIPQSPSGDTILLLKPRPLWRPHNTVGATGPTDQRDSRPPAQLPGNPGH